MIAYFIYYRASFFLFAFLVIFEWDWAFQILFRGWYFGFPLNLEFFKGVVQLQGNSLILLLSGLL